MKIGILGLNEGNGHPYSYSAIFNGYDPDALQKDCPFELIKQYLPREHQNKNSIAHAKVTHIWTQDREMSERVARVSLIPNVVNNYEDLIGKVDAVIIARDDPQNHLAMAKPFLQKGYPLFIDKQLTQNVADFNELASLVTSDYPLMACSPIRYNPKLAELIKTTPPENPLTIQGISRVNWLRYAHHLYEGIAMLYGTDVEYVQYLGFDERHELYVIKYNSGLSVTLEFHLDVKLPIRFIIHSSTHEHVEIAFDDFFLSFKGMLEDFTKMVETKKPVIPLKEMLSIANIVLAGELSKENQGKKIDPRTTGANYAR